MKTVFLSSQTPPLFLCLSLITQCLNHLCGPSSLSPPPQYLHVFVSEVTAMVPVLGDCHHAFSVYTAQRTRRRGPLLLAAPTDQDMTDWVRGGGQSTLHLLSSG